MAKAMVENIVVVGGVVLLMLLLILLLILLACKPWRFFFSRTRTIKAQVDDIERPLVSEDLNFLQNQSNQFSGNYHFEGSCHSTEGHHNTPQLTQSDSLVLDVIPGPSEDIFTGQTLKCSLVTQHAVEEQKYESDILREFIPKGNAESILTLEVLSGPSRGLRCSVQSTNATRLPLTLGRVAPSDLILKDSEISGKHVMINWNLNKLKWEIVDMGSLNGTLLNSKAIHHTDSGSRHWGHPTELANGDIITLGTSTKVFVQITSQTECLNPFGVGLASDPMARRRGAKKLPMEDMCYYHWPLPGADQFGIFGICDGHGGAGAATSASKILPEMVASILSDSFRRERVLSQCDASDVLRDAFLQTEACMNHYYEGCTATVLLVWADGHENFFAQCANVGDSACVINMDGKQIKMTEDHRITSYSERLRIQEVGEPLRDGETRLCGLNLGRMLGDKFLKQQEPRFSSDPYISEVVCIHQASRGFALLASDGFWDVVNFNKAIQLVQQSRERYAADRENPAEKIANFLLSYARTQRTKDNTSIIFLDFDSINRNPCKFDP
ncbi:protein phosphatase 2C 70-like [Actinidia eriantha]|uniref:protein phosphatase 2C 70-like n=1 Tax=Actinidia eriantha TaxID=165200 RepID=UPI002588AB3F|nr:protein phosphatase 2C 70-like [Actinidia eriantha]